MNSPEPSSPWEETKDPFAAAFLKKIGGFSSEQVLKQKVERLDISSGEVVESFNTGTEAYETHSKGESNGRYFADCFLGRRAGLNKNVAEESLHIWHGSFWRLAGSNATPK